MYMLVVDEVNMAVMHKVMPGLRYVRLEGVKLESVPGKLFLVSPEAEQPVQPVPVVESVPEVSSGAEAV